jgi:hypothetical protein
MRGFNYPKTIEGKDIFVLMPIQNNFGEWIPAEISADGLMVDINAKRFKPDQYGQCHEHCKAQNEKYFTPDQVTTVTEMHVSACNYMYVTQNEAQNSSHKWALSFILILITAWIGIK